MPEKHWEDFEVGERVESMAITVTETHVVNWAGLTMDFYPLHMDKEYAAKVSPGDFLVAGKNFGCGSSREHAPIAIKASGASAVIARSFARIFYRNAFNMGLPIFEAPQAIDEIDAGDQLVVDMQRGTLRNETQGKQYGIAPVPPFMQELVAAGGLLNYMATRRKGR